MSDGRWRGNALGNAKVALAAIVAGATVLTGGLGALRAQQSGTLPGDAPVQIAQQAGSAAAPTSRGPSAANAFNRLLRQPSAPANASPAEDGIHDPANPGTRTLQWPSEAFQGLPRSSDGNRVDWVSALDQGLIVPWTDLQDPTMEPFLFDLVIVREVRGSMPNVVYPHEPHTRWLDCSNCHDEIFLPEKGANQMSMAGILLGQRCGVCHGKVAFPVSDCRRCHSQPKTPDELRALADQSTWRARPGGPGTGN